MTKLHMSALFEIDVLLQNILPTCEQMKVIEKLQDSLLPSLLGCGSMMSVRLQHKLFNSCCLAHAGQVYNEPRVRYFTFKCEECIIYLRLHSTLNRLIYASFPASVHTSSNVVQDSSTRRQARGAKEVVNIF